MCDGVFDYRYPPCLQHSSGDASKISSAMNGARKPPRKITVKSRSNLLKSASHNRFDSRAVDVMHDGCKVINLSMPLGTSAELHSHTKRTKDVVHSCIAPLSCMHGSGDTHSLVTARSSRKEKRTSASGDLAGLHISKAISWSLFKYSMEANSLYYSTPTMDFQSTLPLRIHHSYQDNVDASVQSLPPLIHQQSLPLHTQCLSIRYLDPTNSKRMVAGSAPFDRPRNLAGCYSGYPDPLVRGPPKFHKRLAELLGLVSDTMRTESRCKAKCRNSLSFSN